MKLRSIWEFKTLICENLNMKQIDAKVLVQNGQIENKKSH